VISRKVEVSVDFIQQALGGSVPTAGEFKRLFATGREINHDGDPYLLTVVKGIPPDAVVAGPERDADRFSVSYHVISDEFSEEDSPWLTIEGTRCLQPERR
jgi:hypothetical protein